MKKIIPLIITMVLLASYLSAFAEMKTFIKEYTYQASEDDSRNSSRTLAMREVKRLLLEELGTYLESVTEVQNFQLTKDQITTLTAGIVQTQIVDEEWDGHKYWLKSKIMADSGKVINAIDDLRKDRQKVKELEELRRRSDELSKENERLREELLRKEPTVAKGKEKQKDIAAYNKNINELTAIEWYEKGYSSARSGFHKDAIDSFNKVILLNPQHTKAYIGRGFSYASLGNDRQAIEDLNKAIELNPKDAFAYHSRGLAYAKSGYFRQAIEDYNKAIKLDPKDVSHYHYRGLAYHVFGNDRQAVKDFTKVIEFDPKKADAYFARGLAYSKLGKHRLAIEDYKTAARLGLIVARNILRDEGIDW